MRWVQASTPAPARPEWAVRTARCLSVPFLENVALKSRAAGRAEVRRSYEALFRAFPDLAPTSSGEAYGDDAFVNVVPFHNGRMQGEQLFFDLPELCRGIGLAVDDVVRQAAAAQAAT